MMEHTCPMPAMEDACWIILGVCEDRRATGRPWSTCHGQVPGAGHPVVPFSLRGSHGPGLSPPGSSVGTPGPLPSTTSPALWNIRVGWGASLSVHTCPRLRISEARSWLFHGAIRGGRPGPRGRAGTGAPKSEKCSLSSGLLTGRVKGWLTPCTHSGCPAVLQELSHLSERFRPVGPRASCALGLEGDPAGSPGPGAGTGL